MRIRKQINWRNAYAGQWKWETPESIAHPAKMAWGLTFRTLRHMEEIGLLRPGDTVVDFMSGTGRTGVAASAMGYPVVTVELEPHWVSVQTGFECERGAGGRIARMCADENCGPGHYVEGMRERFQRLSGQQPRWAVVEGDARNLPQLLPGAERPAALISPPYADAPRPGGGVNRDGYSGKLSRDPRPMGTRMGYGADRLAGVISPPYGGERRDRFNEMPDGYWELKTGAGPIYEKYGSSQGQIGHMPDDRHVGVTSPPYDNRLADNDTREHMDAEGSHARPPTAYGASSGQIGNMRSSDKGRTYTIDGTEISKGFVPCPENSDRVPIAVNLRGVADGVEVVTSPRRIKWSTLRSVIAKCLNVSGAELDRLWPERITRTGKAATPATAVPAGQLFTVRLKNGMDGLARCVEGQAEKSWLIMSSRGEMADQLRSTISSLSVSPATTVPTILAADDIWLTAKPAVMNTKAVLLNQVRALTDAERNSIRKSSGGGSSAKKPERYEDAMLEVYGAAREVCSVLAVVTKNPTRDGKIMPFHRQTARMLRATGWRLVDYHRALLFDVERQSDLFGNVTESPRGRLSFFKRMAYAKGQPVAQWEDVLFAVAD